jgi:hypothetical protein
MELPLITDQGKLTKKHSPCDIAIASLSWSKLAPEQQLEVKRFILPGLDADLCRCPQCSDKAPDGVWWFNQQMRDWVRTRKIPYCFTGDGLGDVAIEGEGA